MAAASVSARTSLATQGNRRQIVVDFTPSTSYPANGEPMTPSLFGMQQVDVVVPMAPADGSRIVTYDSTNKTLRIYTAISTEAATSSDQSAKVCPLLITGI